MKKFSKFEIATLKRNAQSVNPFVTKRNKLQEKVEELLKEIEMYNKTILTYEMSTKAITGGYTTEDLFNKEYVIAGKDKNGNDIKATKYVLKYPETIIPVEDNNSDTMEESETKDCESCTTAEIISDPNEFNL